MLIISLFIFLILFKFSNIWLALSSQGIWTLAGILLIIFPSTITSAPISAKGNTGKTLNIVAYNSAGNLTPEDMKTLINTFDPDILVLSETPRSNAEQVAQGTAFEKSVYIPLGNQWNKKFYITQPTAVLAHPRLGSVDQISAPESSFGSVALIIDFVSPHIQFALLGLHTAPPLQLPLTPWENDLKRVMSFAEEYTETPLIMAGDFNATLRHGPLANRKRMVDTARQCSHSPEGTWPKDMPPWLRTPIDHVFVSPEFEVLKCKTLTVGRSDHLAYATSVRLP